MFKVLNNPTFRRTVDINVPTDDGFRKESLKATFNVVPADEMDDYRFLTAAGTTEFLESAINRLDDLVDEDGNKLEYDEQVRDGLLRWPFVRQALVREYLAGAQGAKEGN